MCESRLISIACNCCDLDIFVSGFSTVVTTEHLIPATQYMINKISIKSNVHNHNLIIIARYSFVSYRIVGIKRN